MSVITWLRSTNSASVVSCWIKGSVIFDGDTGEAIQEYFGEKRAQRPL